MSVDIFGRQLVKDVRVNKILHSRIFLDKTIGNTSDGQYDAKDKRLCNLADPIEDTDAVSKKVLNIALHMMEQAIDNKLKTLSDAVHSLQMHDSFIRENLGEQHDNLLTLQNHVHQHEKLITALGQQHEAIIAPFDDESRKNLLS